MKNLMKTQLINDILTGLMVAATFGAIAPTGAWAQLSSAVPAAQASVLQPAMQALTYISYGLGSVMVIAGIANAKKHADQPSSNPLGPAIGKLGAGAAFLAAPTVVGMLQQTGQNTTGGGNAQFNASAIGF
jgi:hypothetical protein